MKVAMNPPLWLTFLERRFPSANSVLLHGERPILVDTGFGSDIAETQALIGAAGVPPEKIALIVNTHYHSDHVGGNHFFQNRFGTPIAAHRWDASLVNRRDREACTAAWLDQPIESYTVQQVLSEGDELSTGSVTLRVLHTPAHTLGHIALYEPHEQVLLCGDVLQRDDVAWLNPFREGAGTLERSIEVLERFAVMSIRVAYSGHGAVIDEPKTAIEAALKRYRSWLTEPEKMAWHGAKRIFAYALMLRDGLQEADVEPYLLECLWLLDFSRHIFNQAPAIFAENLLTEIVRSGAAEWRSEVDGKRLVARTPYIAPAPPVPVRLSGAVLPERW